MDKKGNAVIKFVARNPEDRYEFRAKVFPNGSASIDVNMQNRQSISFQGRTGYKEEEKTSNAVLILPNALRPCTF